MTFADHPPTGIVRFVLRGPILLYRLGLGRLLDHRLLLIIHRGRTSHLLRESVVEVVRIETASKTCVVMSGWSGKTDWYRNISREPALEIRIGATRFVPQQRLLSPEETIGELQRYVERHPWLARNVLARGFDVTLDGTDASWNKAADFFRGVQFTPAETGDR